MPGRLLATEPCSGKVHRYDPIPYIQWSLEEGHFLFCARIINHHIEPAELFDGLLDQVLDVLGARDVCVYRDGPAPEAFYLIDYLFGFAGVAPVVDGDRGRCRPSSATRVL